ncbi:MAG TPA: GTP-binding protein, partial [Rhodothermales bacterium]|nr:GTP-binding protein [Rhodothermales bacterium]
KGVFWLVSEADTMWVWSQAGQTREYFPGGGWLATLPRSEWQHEHLPEAEIERIWHPEHGDRRQEIAFIGIDMSQEVLTQALNWCLVTEEEMALASWQNDPMVESLFA